LKFLNTSDEAIAELQNRLRDRILEYIQKNYYGLFELSDKERKYKNSAIIIDFDENKLGRKRFSKAVYNITDMTVRFLLQELVINQASD
ncbi:MAG: hypothetical protein FJ088_07965, partial [Deltaproteobacteria bacterium]|nr:hypothetical protein [Deltaproteobacteria bacterium]